MVAMMKPELLFSTASGSRPVGSACWEITRVSWPAARTMLGLAAMKAPAPAAVRSSVRREILNGGCLTIGMLSSLASFRTGSTRLPARLEGKLCQVACRGRPASRDPGARRGSSAVAQIKAQPGVEGKSEAARSAPLRPASSQEVEQHLGRALDVGADRPAGGLRIVAAERGEKLFVLVIGARVIAGAVQQMEIGPDLQP